MVGNGRIGAGHPRIRGAIHNERYGESAEQVGDGRSASGFARRRRPPRLESLQARELCREGVDATLQRRVFFVHGGVAGRRRRRRGARGGEWRRRVEARAEGPRGGGGTTTPARDPPPENVRRRAGLGERREIGVDARLAGLGDRRETEVGVEARRRRAAASAAPVAWRAIGDGDRAWRAAARGGEKKKPSRPPPRATPSSPRRRLRARQTSLPEVAAVEPRPRRPRRGPPLRRPELGVLRSASSSVEQRRSS